MFKKLLRKTQLYKLGYREALMDAENNLIRNSITREVDDEIHLVVTDSKIKYIFNEMRKKMGFLI